MSIATPKYDEQLVQQLTENLARMLIESDATTGEVLLAISQVIHASIIRSSLTELRRGDPDIEGMKRTTKVLLDRVHESAWKYIEENAPK